MFHPQSCRARAASYLEHLPATYEGIAAPDTKMSVALDDVEGSSIYGRVMSAVQRSASGRGTPFDWEMRLLHETGELGNAEFWEGGVRVGNPF